jgi:hypothetical protein
MVEVTSHPIRREEKTMSEPEGGLGGTTGRGIRDTRLVERALRERWPVSKALRRPLIERLAAIAQDPKASPREATSAAKAILSASRLNLEVVAKAIDADKHENVLRRLEALERTDEHRGPSDTLGTRPPCG